MTVEQAIDLVDRGLSMVAASRQDHINFQIAIDTIRQAINPSLKDEQSE